MGSVRGVLCVLRRVPIGRVHLQEPDNSDRAVLSRRLKHDLTPIPRASNKEMLTSFCDYTLPFTTRCVVAAVTVTNFLHILTGIVEYYQICVSAELVLAHARGA